MTFRAGNTIPCVFLLLVGCALAKLPGQSKADPSLQKEVNEVIMTLDRTVDNNVCSARNIVLTEIVDSPKDPVKDPWVEKWTVDRCGKTLYYKVKFLHIPDMGRTVFTVSRWE